MVTVLSPKCPKESPWGAVDNPPTELLPGMFSVSTPGHGGIWLAPDLAKVAEAVMGSIMPDWRPFTRSWSWLEEDCDWVVAALTFPGGFRPDAVAYAMRAVSQSGYLSADPELLAAFWLAPAGLAVIARANDLVV